MCQCVTLNDALISIYSEFRCNIYRTVLLDNQDSFNLKLRYKTQQTANFQNHKCIHIIRLYKKYKSIIYGLSYIFCPCIDKLQKYLQKHGSDTVL